MMMIIIIIILIITYFMTGFYQAVPPQRLPFHHPLGRRIPSSVWLVILDSGRVQS
jgi:hypothetical protein